MEKEKYKINIVPADDFKTDYGTYEFPFEALDKTPGGSNLGRIEWHIEPFKSKKNKGRYYIEKILVFASQTRDERYKGKIFEIPCYTESITADSLHNRDSYFHYVWRMLWCEVHNTVYFSAYPKNKHKKLVINVESSISSEIEFV